MSKKKDDGVDKDAFEEDLNKADKPAGKKKDDGEPELAEGVHLDKPEQADDFKPTAGLTQVGGAPIIGGVTGGKTPDQAIRDVLPPEEGGEPEVELQPPNPDGPEKSGSKSKGKKRPSPHDVALANLKKRDPLVREHLDDDAVKKEIANNRAKEVLVNVGNDANDDGIEDEPDITTAGRRVETPGASPHQGQDVKGDDYGTGAAVRTPDNKALNTPVNPNDLPMQGPIKGGLRRHVRNQVEVERRARASGQR